MRTIEISTFLNAPPEVVQDHVGRSELLNYVARGMIRFKAIDPPQFPERWAEGHYKANMYWKGFLPVGWQSIGIEPQPMSGETWSLRDNGHGGLIKTWDHMIEVSPQDDGSYYVDRITIDAGLLTPFVGLFAGRFYKHRQKRWRRLVANGFDYSK